MRIEFSSELFAALRHLQARTEVLDTPRHQAAIDAMPDVQWSAQSIGASQIVLSRPGGYTLTLQGSGISPVSSLDALFQAIDSGVATGAFSSITLRQGNTVLAQLGLAANGWTLTSDTLSLAVTGAVPTSLQQLIAIMQAEAMSWQNPQALANLLNTYALTGLTLRDAGEVLFGLSMAAQAVTLQLPGLTGTLDGVFPTRLGDLLEKIANAQDAAGWFGNWGEILLYDEFQAGALTFRNAQGAVVLRMTETDQPGDTYVLIDGGQNLEVFAELVTPDVLAALIDGDMTFVAGTAGPDRLTLLAQPAFVHGGTGNDTITTGTGDDVIIGWQGDDFIISGAGNDTVYGGSGNDTVWSGPGDDLVLSGSGNNEFWTGAGNDTLFGGNGNDTLGGGAGDDYISARNGGVNQLWGGDGRDTLYTSDNGDMAGGGGGDDLVYGGAGADMLIGGLGNDTVHGYGGNDALYLSIGNDMGYGGAGNDTIFAGAGFDQLWGGAGADQFEFYRNFGWNRVEDFSAADGDVLGLGRWMWTGTHGPLTAAQVVQTFGRVTSGGDAVLEFASAGTTVVVVGLGSLDGLADSIVIL